MRIIERIERSLYVRHGHVERGRLLNILFCLRNLRVKIHPMELGIEIVFSYVTGNNLQNRQSAAAIQSRHLRLLRPTEYRQQGYRCDKCSIARFCFEERRLRSFRGFRPGLQIVHAGSPSVGPTSAAIPLGLNGIGPPLRQIVGEKSRLHKFALSFRLSGEQKAQSCDNAWFRQL